MSRLARGTLSQGASEVAIVVLGILIAFGLDAWWDTRSNDHWERAQLELLLDETQANLKHIDDVISVHEQIAADVTAILEFATKNRPGTVTDIPDTELTALVAWRTSEVSTGTLDALLAAGELGRLQNPELRKRLAAWPALLLDAQEAETLARDFVEFIMTPALLGQGVIAPAHAKRPGRGVLPSAVKRNVAITATSQLADLSAARLSHTLIARDSLIDLQDKLRQIEFLLEQGLAR